MPKNPIDSLMKVEIDLKMQDRQLKRQVNTLEKQDKAACERMTKLMKAGNEAIINSQAEIIANLRGQREKLELQRGQVVKSLGLVTTVKTNVMMARSMSQVSEALQRVGQTINLEALEQRSNKGEEILGDIQVMADMLAGATKVGSAGMMDPEEVERIKSQFRDNKDLEMGETMGAVPAAKVGPTKEEEEASSERLKALREQM